MKPGNYDLEMSVTLLYLGMRYCFRMNNSKKVVYAITTHTTAQFTYTHVLAGVDSCVRYYRYYS